MKVRIQVRALVLCATFFSARGQIVLSSVKLASSSPVAAVLEVAADMEGFLSKDADSDGFRFGPKNCVQVTKAPVGSCVISTHCEGLDTSMTEFAFDCVKQNAIKRHSYGVGGFESEEEFDSEVKCDRCEMPPVHQQPVFTVKAPLNGVHVKAPLPKQQSSSWEFTSFRHVLPMPRRPRFLSARQATASSAALKSTLSAGKRHMKHDELRPVAKRHGVVGFKAKLHSKRHSTETGKAEPTQPTDQLRQVAALSGGIKELTQELSSISAAVTQLNGAVFKPKLASAAQAPAPAKTEKQEEKKEEEREEKKKAAAFLDQSRSSSDVRQNDDNDDDAEDGDYYGEQEDKKDKDIMMTMASQEEQAVAASTKSLAPEGQEDGMQNDDDDDTDDSENDLHPMSGAQEEQEEQAKEAQDNDSEQNPAPIPQVSAASLASLGQKQLEEQAKKTQDGGEDNSAWITARVTQQEEDDGSEDGDEDANQG